MKILVLNGPNINMLGIREPKIYGRETYDYLLKTVHDYAEKRGVIVDQFQSNREGELVDHIQQALNTYDGIVINPAAYTHTSIAIADALAAVALPTVEVHISDTSARESFRRVSFVRDLCIATVQGEGIPGYCHAIDILLEHLKENA